MVLCASICNAQIKNNTRTKFTSWLGAPTLDNPPIDSIGGINFYPTANKLGYRNNTANQYLASEMWVLGNYSPLARTLTINGVTYDLSQNRTWTIAETPQTLSLGAVAGNIAISSGNNISLASLATSSVTDANTLSNTNGGLYAWTYSSSATNFPSSTSGVVLSMFRNGATANSSFQIAKEASSSNSLSFRVGTGAGTWGSWDIFAGRTWTGDNYEPLSVASKKQTVNKNLTSNTSIEYLKFGTLAVPAATNVSIRLTVTSNSTSNTYTGIIVTDYSVVITGSAISSITSNTTVALGTLAGSINIGTPILDGSSVLNIPIIGNSGSTRQINVTAEVFGLNTVVAQFFPLSWGTSGTGVFPGGTINTTEKSLQVGTVGNATGDFATWSAGNILQKRTLAQTVTDLGIPTMLNYTASGNGSSTAIVITHGLSGITTASKVNVTALNAASAGFLYVTPSSTTFTITYSVAPVTGTNNLSYTISSKP